MTNAITQISYQSDAIQNLCLASAPTYNSPFCSLAIRPITDPTDPNYKNPDFNFPTEIRNSPLNAAEQKIEGYDFGELDYDAPRDTGWRGHFSLRHLLSYQPDEHHVNLPGAFPTWAVAAAPAADHVPVVRRTSGWSLALQNQWLSKVKLPTSDNALNGNRPELRRPEPRPVSTCVDAHRQQAVRHVGDSSVEVFLTVNNCSTSALRCSRRTRVFRAVLSDAGFLRRHGPVLHPGVPHEF